MHKIRLSSQPEKGLQHAAGLYVKQFTSQVTFYELTTYYFKSKEDHCCLLLTKQEMK